VLLYPEQFIDHIRGHWGGDQDYRFGVLYRTKEGNSEFRVSLRRASVSKNSPLGKMIRKDKETVAKKNARDKKKTVAMNVNFTMHPVG